MPFTTETQVSFQNPWSSGDLGTPSCGKENDMTDSKPQSLESPWPNQTFVVDGIVPASEVPQDPDLFDNDHDDLLVTED